MCFERKGDGLFAAPGVACNLVAKRGQLGLDIARDDDFIFHDENAGFGGRHGHGEITKE